MCPFSKQEEEKKLPFSTTQEMLAEAKNNPNGWVYQIEGSFGPNNRVPPECVVGAYKVDEKSLLTGEFKSNPNFKKA